jgi:hypothetical protein
MLPALHECIRKPEHIVSRRRADGALELAGQPDEHPDPFRVGYRDTCRFEPDLLFKRYARHRPLR